MEKRQAQLNSQIRECSKDSTNDFRIAGENNNAILSLKCRAEAEKEQFEAEIKRL